MNCGVVGELLSVLPVDNASQADVRATFMHNSLGRNRVEEKSGPIFRASIAVFPFLFFGSFESASGNGGVYKPFSS
jgi:hypothetical protein